MSPTNTRKGKFLYFQQMENSETRKEVIDLGKLFVKELKLDRGGNTFARWIAHYMQKKSKKLKNPAARKEK